MQVHLQVAELEPGTELAILTAEKLLTNQAGFGPVWVGQTGRYLQLLAL